MIAESQKYVCCFCHQEYFGWGNNPYPANKEENARCCDDCNSCIVIPARLYLARRKSDKE